MAEPTDGNRANTIIGVGAGGHAKSVIDAVRSTGLWNIVGLIDANRDLWGTTIMGCSILGGDEELQGLLRKGVTHAFIGIGGVSDNTARTKIFKQLVQLGLTLPPICHRTSIVSPSASLDIGSVILAGAIVGADARLGKNVVVNS